MARTCLATLLCLFSLVVGAVACSDTAERPGGSAKGNPDADARYADEAPTSDQALAANASAEPSDGAPSTETGEPELEAANAAVEPAHLSRGSDTMSPVANPPGPPVAADPNIWLAAALAGVSLALLLCLATMRYLMSWRRSYSENGLSIFPERILWDFHSQVGNQSTCIEQLSRAMVSLRDDSLRRESEHSAKLSELLDSFMSLQRTLDEREREIARLRRGYDAEVFRRFIRRFLRLDEALADEIESLEPEQKHARQVFEQMRDLLDDCLAECGLQRFAPRPGESLREVRGVSDRWYPVPTTSPEEHYTIAEVIEHGMMIRTAEGGEVVKQAVVKAYVYEEPRPEPPTLTDDAEVSSSQPIPSSTGTEAKAPPESPARAETGAETSPPKESKP